MMRKITIGTRASKLALVQTQIVVDALMAAHPNLDVRVERITTKGDLILDRPLAAIGDKQLFITEIEDALRDGRIDLAVHSAKDLAAECPPDMQLAAFLPRANPRDAVIGRRLLDLPEGAIVGTGSARRRCQILAVRPDLRVIDLRGNVDTRLRKLREGQYDAIILARAGLDRLGLSDVIVETLAPERMIPAVGQGVLALEARKDDAVTARYATSLDHPATRKTITAERAFLARIGGGCHAPVAAFAKVTDKMLVITGMIGSEDGHMVRGRRSVLSTRDPALLGARLAEDLLAKGGAEFLREEVGVGDGD